jgi:hypothetical protein
MNKGEEEPFQSKDNKSSVTFDDVLEVLGEFGNYQKCIYFLFSLPYVFTSMQLIGWVFIGASVPFKCRNSLPFEAAWNSSESNGCSYTEADGLELQCTDGFHYDTSQIKDSVTMEFNLVIFNIFITKKS